MTGIALRIHALLNSSRAIDFLGPLALRLYLVPIFWMAGTNKLRSIDSTSSGSVTVSGGWACPSRH